MTFVMLNLCNCAVAEQPLDTGVMVQCLRHGLECMQALRHRRQVLLRAPGVHELEL